MFDYRDRQLYCEDVPLTAVAHQFGTPLYIYSQQEIERSAHAYLDSAPAGAMICYAVKANGNPAILRLLGMMGLGADVTSGGELFLAHHAGIPPQRIIYSGVGKRRNEIEMAVQMGIRALHVETEQEMAIIADVAEQQQKVVAIGVRVNPDIAADTHPHISTGSQAHKFGVPPATAVALLHFAANHQWLKPVGLAAHIGSQITDMAPFIQSAQFLVELAQELSSVGLRLDYLDVGGGYGVDYTNNLPADSEKWVTAVAQPVTQAGYNIVMEPGRSIIASAGILLTQVVYTKNQGQKQFAITDAGMSELIRPTLYDANHPILLVQQPAENHDQITIDVVGPICETGDFLAQQRPLPPIKQGDYLAIGQAGAYGFAMSSNYNGRLKPAEILINSDQVTVIRPRQTYDDLIPQVTD